ncbi:MAG: phosphatase PAP2 family protein [Chloroflexota bacterium]
MPAKNERSDKAPLLAFNLTEALKVYELYTLVILTLYTALAVIFYSHIPNARDLIFLNAVIIIGLIAIAAITEKVYLGELFLVFRRIYIVPIVFLAYSQVQYYIRVVNPYLYDDILIKMDYYLLGFHPTWITGKIAFPALTEYLQGCYMLFYFMPIIHCVELFFKGRQRELNELQTIIVFAFYASYLLYVFMPAVGPRFTLHNFATTDLDLPGLALADFFRNIVNVGGSIIPGSAHPELLVNRDCMPSGHTWITLVNIILAFRNKSSFRWVILVLGSSLIFSTVYLRYHYFVDVLAGAVFALLTLAVEPKVRAFVLRRGLARP